MKIWTVPNSLTFIRIALIPCFVIIFYIPFPNHRWVVAALFLVAAFTDWLDGFLARHLKQTSPFGEFLDPVADKLIVSTALVLLVSEHPSFLVAIPSLVIVAREIVVSALREWMAELGKRAIVKVSWVGKAKTAIQMVSILILLSQPAGYNSAVITGLALMYVAVILTVWSMLVYVKAALRSFELLKTTS